MYYGIPAGLEYSVSDQAQLSTLTNEDGTPINLFEQGMKALRVTMHVAALVVRCDEAFAGLNMTTDDNVFETMPGHGQTPPTPMLLRTRRKPKLRLASR